MFVSPINFNSFNIISHKNLPNYRIFIQKPDEVSFSGKRPFSFTDKGILQSAIDECENKEIIESLLKKEDGLYKYRPFTIFEILTQKDKPNFVENLKMLQEFRLDNEPLQPCEISEMLAACDGQDVKSRLETLTAVKEKGIELPIKLFCTNNDKFARIQKNLKNINEHNTRKIRSICYSIAASDIQEPIKNMSAEEKLLYYLFGKRKAKKDDLEKLIESGKYKNITKRALNKYKKEHFDNYVELYKKSKSMPQILDMINHLVGLGKHSRYKEAWLRKQLIYDFNFEDVANIVLQKKSPIFATVVEIYSKLLLGKKSPELKKRIREFKKRTGINIFADANIPISCIDRYEKIVPSLRNHYVENSDIVRADITSVIQEGLNGFCYGTGITINPLNTDFEATVFHEYAHVAHKRCIPYNEGGSRLKAWEDLTAKPFYPKDSIEYKTTITQLGEYATSNFVEFVAELNKYIGVGKFEVVINEKGEKVLRKYLKDGDTTTAKDLEMLMNIYESVFGPDVGAKKPSNTSSEYVETPFKGTQKFSFLKFFLNKAKDSE